MRKLLNTLYINDPDYSLGREGKIVVIWKDDKKIAKIPIHNFEELVCFNYTGVSSSLLELCVENQVSVSLLTSYGKFRARIVPPVSGNILLRKEQFKISEIEDLKLGYAKRFVISKLYNQFKVLDRYSRDYPENSEVVQESKRHLVDARKLAKKVESYQSLLGIEGEASQVYFSHLNDLIRANKETFTYHLRSRRPPLDPVNSLLSLSYGLIRSSTKSALETVGLDPYVGFYRVDRPGRESLALDLMEEFRSYLGDRFVISIINRKQFSKDDFQFLENGAVLLKEDSRKKFLDLWQKRKQDTITHPFLEEQIPLGLLPYVQAQLLARTIRGDLPSYPPFFMD